MALGAQRVGAATTGLVMLVIAGTKFIHGAWMVVLLIPLLVALFMMIRRHYADVARQLSLDDYGGAAADRPHRCWSWSATSTGAWRAALRYAQTLSTSAKAVYVEIDPEPDPEARGEVGQVRAGRPAGGADLALPVAARRPSWTTSTSSWRSARTTW